MLISFCIVQKGLNAYFYTVKTGLLCLDVLLGPAENAKPEVEAQNSQQAVSSLGMSLLSSSSLWEPQAWNERYQLLF